MIRRGYPRVLHLYSDWKWTGPADPTIQLCSRLIQEGWEVLLACRRPLEGYPQSILQKAAEEGVPVTTDLHLNRYLAPDESLKDLRRISRLIRTNEVRLIHCHLSHDHALGAWSSWITRMRVPVVRTNHKGLPIRPSIGNRLLLDHLTDGLVEFSSQALRGDRERFSIPSGRHVLVNPAVDPVRFHPGRVRRDIRHEIGASSEAMIVGVVARMQRHRRFHILLKAMELIKDKKPPVYLMVLGRGTHRDRVAIGPARALGLANRVIFPGYRTTDYVDYLGGMDVKVMLVPGSDGTCRAVREAMAMGKPAVVARRGMLPEIVVDGVTGIVIEDTPENLAQALLRLAQNPQLRTKLGEAARRRVVQEFNPSKEAGSVGRLYERILEAATKGSIDRIGERRRILETFFDRLPKAKGKDRWGCLGGYSSRQVKGGCRQ